MNTEHQWKSGDKIRLLQEVDHYAKAGDLGTLQEREHATAWWVDFNGTDGQPVWGDGIWCVHEDDMEPA